MVGAEVIGTESIGVLDPGFVSITPRGIEPNEVLPLAVLTATFSIGLGAAETLAAKTADKIIDKTTFFILLPGYY